MEITAPSAQEALLENFFRQQASEAALLLNTFPAETALGYLGRIPAYDAAAVFSRMGPDTASELVEGMSDELFTAIFSEIDTHLSARLLSRVDESEATARLALLPNIVSAEIREFMVYRPQTAGFLMDTYVATFNLENTVQDVLNKIRKHADRRVTSVYIINDSGDLAGAIPLQVIAISDPGEKLKELAQPVPVANALSPREEVLTIMERENLLQIPVTDINQKFLGIIRNEALLDATKQELTEDMQAMFGASREEKALSSVLTGVKSRLPWLQVNLATAFLASFVVGMFEDTIAQITILAVFLPVVAGQSGNTGSQALAVTMRGLALREVRISQWFVVARKEIMVGLINGIAVAITTGTIVYFWSGSAGIGLVIGISMVISMMIAGFSGAVIPMGLQAIGQDPATSSSIILTTVTDICGFLSFLGLASALASVLGII